jgi:3-phenylpropionate/trans-cinnamate dioxygenase ferredoxin reductase subunit
VTRIVVVGAGVGGLRAAEALRAAGHDGELVVVGDEPRHPYQRPPLSKTLLAGGVEPDGLTIRRRKSVADVEWRLGVTVVGADLGARVLHLVTAASGDTGAGDELAWDGLVIATGLRSKRLNLPGSTAHRHAVRSLHDALELRAELVPGARVVIVGAGFLGCEIAASAVGLGCDVAVVAPEAEPMERQLGTLVGAAMRRRHEDAGVRFRLGRVPVSLDPGGAGVALDDGTALPADVVVEAVGSVPATGWLAGTDLDLTDGVLCDSWLRAVGSTGPRADVVAVGDVARFPHPLAGPPERRIEHWDMPPLTAKRAAPALVAGLAGVALDPEPFVPVPSFWSDQYDVTIQSFGTPELADEVEVVEGNLRGPFLAAYRQAVPGGPGGTRLVAAVGVGTMSGLLDLRAALATGVTADVPTEAAPGPPVPGSHAAG